MRGIIFDMDGVIADSESLHFQAEQEIFNEHNIELNKEEHMKLMGLTENDFWQHLKCNHGLKEELDILIQKKSEKYFKLLKNIKPRDNVVETINILSKKYKLALASSSPLDQINFILNKFKIKHLFSSIISGETIERSKPAPDIFLESAAKLGIPNKDCFVVEDSINGVIAANRAGIKVIAFPHDLCEGLDYSNADFIIKDFKEILTIVD